jgi:hypothetical protein
MLRDVAYTVQDVLEAPDAFMLYSGRQYNGVGRILQSTHPSRSVDVTPLSITNDQRTAISC